MSEIQLLKVYIDGTMIEVPQGTTIMEASRLLNNGSVPPAMCYYKPLEGTGGKCRVCLVDVTKGSEKDPRPMPKLVPSCLTQVMDGMEVGVNNSQKAIDGRNGVTEFLLINHPLDCPVCDQAGECKLQDLSVENGNSKSRYKEEKREYDPIELGENIKLNMNRCIMCYRCVFTANQLCNNREHGVLFRGDKSEISTYIEKSLDSNFYGNVIDVCPVGALTDKTARFKSRVWFTKKILAKRNCSECSGEVVLHFVENEIVRVSARKNEWDEVNSWICNCCRFENKDLKNWEIVENLNSSNKSVQSLNQYEEKSSFVKPKVTNMLT